MKRINVYFLTTIILLITIPSINAALITGNIYDISLNKADSAVIRINTTPNQVIVAIDGEYDVELENGQYQFIVTYKDNGLDYNYEEIISIEDQGSYTIDIILLPDISEETDLYDDQVNYEELDSEVINEKENNTLKTVAIIIISILLLSILHVFYVAKLRKEKHVPKDMLSSELSVDVLNYIQKEKQTTQKEIRSHFPFSEAKISLVITELESQNKIKKIKKGRGNIIVLK